ncbi:IucA/IucC family protein [Saccharothrix violaceirubra]|uniref:Siderophore synthetase component n=1 Tax=Saccharothrix violaceirubra TaxID=413306 RepID=A0A7W7T0Y2_9PSEU|nr:IucA/IucC family protein [Saccharothrix violaceirubra]MBB4964569.1 siderophore synthetase component [Saccharothrix violaceirubra]
MTDLWHECSAALLAKAIGELCFEGLLTPGPGYALRFPDAVYTFTAERTAFGGWVVDPASVHRTATGVLGDDVVQPCADVQRFLADALVALDVDPATTAGFLAEVTATLAADVALAATARPSAELASMGRAELDGHLTGHPWLIANKGRIGFGAEDVARYAPESRTPLRLPWLAVHRGLAEFRGTSELSEEAVLRHELDPMTVERFTEVVQELGVDPRAYVWLPVHPWQLDHVVRTLWAPELATGRIVELGEGPDWYLPTQAIRTMSNVDDPGRFQVKLPLRVLNTSVYRGIPPHCTAAAPVVTQWLRGLWDADKLIGEWGTALLGEVASVTVRHPVLSRAGAVPYQWLETLGCIWREPVVERAGERSWSLAAVLHVDRDGRPLVRSFVGSADPEVWFSTLLRVLLRPLLHLLYTYGITVNPHGENVVVITDGQGMPVRVALLDLVDDVNLSVDRVPERGPEPDAHDHVLPRKPWRVLRQYIVDALLIGVFRPLARLLDVPGERFWGLVRGEVDAYRTRFPSLGARMDAGSLTEAEFLRFPLNSYRLTLGYRDLAARPPVPTTGTVPNPLHHVTAVPPHDGW